MFYHCPELNEGKQNGTELKGMRKMNISIHKREKSIIIYQELQSVPR